MQDVPEERSNRAEVPDQDVVRTSLAPEDTKMFPMSFDEYPELVEKELQLDAKNLATNTSMFDEFIASEIEKGNIPARKK